MPVIRHLGPSLWHASWQPSRPSRMRRCRQLSPKAAGEVLYVKHGIGEWAGLLVGYGLIITALLSSAVISLAFARYVSSFSGLPNLSPCSRRYWALAGCNCGSSRECWFCGPYHHSRGRNPARRHCRRPASSLSIRTDMEFSCSTAPTCPMDRCTGWWVSCFLCFHRFRGHREHGRRNP